MDTKKRKFLFFLVVFSLISLFYTPVWAETDPGVQLFNAGKFSEAKSYFEKAFREDTTNDTAAFYLGRIDFINDEYNKAIEWLEKSVQLDQKRSEYYRWLGRAYGYKTRAAIFFKQPSLAKKTLKMFEKAAALDPDNIQARIDLIHYYLKAPGFVGGGKDKAEKQAEEIQKRDANIGLLARGLIDTGKKKYAQAEENLQAFLNNKASAENRSLLAEGHYELGIVYEKQGKKDRAEEEFQRALDLDFDNKEAKIALKKLKS
jgi:tetratricopeptide (TPR) repeat protein